MNIEEFREYCLAKAGATESLPFGSDTLVFKVGGKMFALCSLSQYENGIALKCEPERAVELREQYPQVRPGYHMSKVHWNTVELDGSVHAREVKDWIDDSYDLVVKGLKRADREALLRGG